MFMYATWVSASWDGKWMFTRKANSEQTAVVEHAPNCRTIRLTAGPEEFVPRDNI